MNRLGRWWVVLLVVASGAALIATATTVFPFLSDDALISLRYAQRLAHGQGLTWTDGDRTEGYSDLLWVLLQVPGFWLKLDPIAWARGVGLFGTLLGVWCVGIDRTGHFGAARVLSTFFLATSVPLATWAIAGLEHGFLAGLVGLGLVVLQRGVTLEAGRQRWLTAGALFAAVTLCRADGAVLVAFAALGVLLAQPRRAPRRLGWFLLAPVSAFAAQAGFRWLYTGTLVPNTALVKVSLNAERARLGAEWVAQGLLASGVLVGLALLAVVVLAVLRQRWARLVVPLCVSVGWLGYVAVVGGDIFPAWRQLVPALVPMGLLIAEGAEALLSSIPRAWPLLALGGAAALVGHVRWQAADPENHRALTERWEWPGLPLGLALKRAWGPQRPLLAVDAAGALPFWSELPALDMLGLNDSWIPRHPPPGFGHGGIGHELGDGDYVLRRAPDVVAFCNAVGAATPCFIGGRQMLADPRFAREYRLVRVEAEGVVGELWVRFTSGPLSATLTAERAQVPGYFLASSAPTTAQGPSLDVMIDDQRVGAIELELPPGTWRARTQPAVDGLLTSWRCGAHTAAAGGDDALTLRAPQRVLLELRSPQPATVHQVVLERDERGLGWSCEGPPLVDGAHLSLPRAEHTGWNAPGVVVFDEAGATLRYDTLKTGSTVELSADNNDTYRLEFFREDSALASVEVPPIVNGGGLATHVVDVPVAARAGFDTIRVTPVAGDGAYSLGHLTVR